MRPILNSLLAGCFPMLLLATNPTHAEDTLSERAQTVLIKHCANCHGPYGTAKGGFNYVLDRDRLLAREQVVAGKPDESPLLQRIEQGEMPPAKRPRLGSDEIQ